MNNSFEVFRQGSSKEVFNNKVIERLNKNPEFFTKILTDEHFASELFGFLVKPVYQRILEGFRDRI